ncbi:unnamed protein product [Rhizophagus irregularis]|uniref:Protein kinase domain-containing protein n=1 Tax=Rhizophagus irregularis TaxID=588596 RepID=A0A915YRA8_9GLOM|nr:unnamed protein product [Rhizophagus irregularis]
MGLCKPADYDASKNTKNSTYGVLSYIAPEILRGQNYTKASDIYSFEAIYTSRLLNFNNLPEPKNSDDYYEHYDNITSTEYSESLQIDVSQSNIIEDDQNINSNDEAQNLEQKS